MGRRPATAELFAYGDLRQGWARMLLGNPELPS